MTSSLHNAELSAAAHRLRGLRAVLFDLDGVLTPTADVHRHAWSRLFTPYLELRGAKAYTEDDYFSYIDGMPRYDGVRTLLASRDIVISEGDPSDTPETETVCGLGNRKNLVFNQVLAEEGVTPYPGSVTFLNAVVALGLDVAVVSSSRNADAVLTAAGLRHHFEIIVDGMLAAAQGIAGKPAPDTYVEGAKLLGHTPAECVVVEDAQSGVQAGKAGDFGFVLGVDRGIGAETLIEYGADIVVDDLAEFVPLLTAGGQRS